MPSSGKIHAMNQFRKFLTKLPTTLGSLALISLILPRVITTLYAWNRIFDAASSPTDRVAIVFGAGLKRDGSPAAVLRDRVETAARLYFSGKVEKLLMSGDNSVVQHNEPEAMRQYALSLGVPDEAIVLDYAGRRTYDTCYRAKAIFGVNSAILVTQKFHMPRALYLCNSLCIRAVGVVANNQTYRHSSLIIWNIRERVF
jgi:vancomycin permeability regulator SanA